MKFVANSPEEEVVVNRGFTIGHYGLNGQASWNLIHPRFGSSGAALNKSVND